MQDVLDKVAVITGAASGIETRQGERFWKMLTDTQAHGLDPDEVGPIVPDAIRHFWVLTRQGMARYVQSQVEAMVGDRSLTRA